MMLIQVFCILLTLLLLGVNAEESYWQTVKPLTEFTLTPNESLRIDLHEYIQGYNLSFGVLSHPEFNNVTITNPYTLDYSLIFNTTFQVLNLNDEDPFFYALDMDNNFYIYSKTANYPTTNVIAQPIHIQPPKSDHQHTKSKSESNSIFLCQQALKVKDPKQENMFYFVVDCNYNVTTDNYKTTAHIISFNLSSSTLLLVQDMYTNSIFDTVQCNRSLSVDIDLSDITTLYRFCPLSSNPQAKFNSIIKNESYWEWIEVYTFNFPDLKLETAITGADLGIDRLKIQSMLTYRRNLVIIDYMFGIYYLTGSTESNKSTFNVVWSHPTSVSNNELLDYIFTFGTSLAAESILKIILQSNGSISEIDILYNNAQVKYNYNLNYNSEAKSATILSHYIVMVAYSDYLKKDFLKIYRKGSPIILLDIPLSTTTYAGDLAQFFIDQDKIIIVETSSSKTNLSIFQIQPTYLEINGTNNDVDKYTPVYPPYTLVVGDDYSRINLSVSIIPFDQVSIYPNNKNITVRTSHSNFEYNLSGICKGPAITYGWLNPPEAPYALKNTSIKINSQVKISFKDRDMTEYTYMDYSIDWNVSSKSKLNVLSQKCDNGTCEATLDKCAFYETLEGNYKSDSCENTGTSKDSLPFSQTLILDPFIHSVSLEKDSIIQIFSVNPFELQKTHNMTEEGCQQVKLLPSSHNNTPYYSCYYNDKTTAIFIIINDSELSVLTLVPRDGNQIKFIDAALLEEGLLIYRNSTHVMIDKLIILNPPGLLPSHIFSQQLCEDTAPKGFKVIVVKANKQRKIIILDFDSNTIKEYNINNPHKMVFSREYSLYGLELSVEQPHFKPGNDFFVVIVNSSVRRTTQHYVIFDPTNDSGSVFLYIDTVSSTIKDTTNQWVPLSKNPVLVNTTKEGININLIERNPMIKGSFDLSSVVNDTLSREMQANFSIRCVTFSYHLKNVKYYKEGSFDVSATLKLQDRKIYKSREAHATEFDFKDSECQSNDVNQSYFNGPIGSYNLQCLESVSDCPYTLRDYLSKNYVYAPYLDSRTKYGAPIKIRSINNSLVVLLSEYRVSFISLHGDMEEYYYDLREYSFTCDQFVQAPDDNSILVVCQKDKLNVYFLKFSLHEKDIKNPQPKIMDLPHGIEFSKVTRMAVTRDLVLVVGYQELNFDISTLFIFRMSGSQELCIVQQIQLNQYSQIGDVAINYFYWQEFALTPPVENVTHMMIAIQQPKQVSSVFLNVTRINPAYSTCKVPVYNIDVWAFHPLDIGAEIKQFDTQDNNITYDVSESKLNIGYASFEQLSMISESRLSCVFLVGTSDHSYTINTTIDLVNMTSSSRILTVYRRYIECENYYPDRLMSESQYFFMFCKAEDEMKSMNLLMYNSKQNCQISANGNNITECMPIRMLDIGYQTSQFSICIYRDNSTKHILVSSYVNQFVDYSINENLGIVLKDEYFLEKNLTEKSTKLGLRPLNSKNQTYDSITLTVYNYNKPIIIDDYEEILDLILYGFIMGVVIVLIYGMSKLFKKAINERGKSSGQETYSFLGRRLTSNKKNPPYKEYEF